VKSLAITWTFLGVAILTSRIPYVQAQTTGNTLAGKLVSALALDPNSTGSLYAGTQLGVFRSQDEGATWNADKFGWAAGPTALRVAPAGTIYATVYDGRDDGLFKSTDAGATWQKILDAVGLWALAVDAQNPGTLYAGAGYGDIGAVEGLFKSIDHGATWLNVLRGVSVYAIAIDPQNADVVYVGGTGGIYKSTNAGLTWRNVYWYPNVYGLSLAINSENPSTIYAGTYGVGLLKSADAGASWAPVFRRAMSVSNVTIDPQDIEIVYFNGSSYPGERLFKTVDGGRSWIDILTLPAHRMTSILVDPKTSTLYIGTPAGVWKSADGGVNWITSPLLSFTALRDRPDYCVGREWHLQVSHAPANASLQLSGTSNGDSWVLPDWGRADSAGFFKATGSFAPEAIGIHSIQAEVAGLPSNEFTIAVASCRSLTSPQ
jgi:photosystem II stability/assembly factor-like uncharacterized protein